MIVYDNYKVIRRTSTLGQWKPGLIMPYSLNYCICLRTFDCLARNACLWAKSYTSSYFLLPSIRTYLATELDSASNSSFIIFLIRLSYDPLPCLLFPIF